MQRGQYDFIVVPTRHKATRTSRVCRKCRAIVLYRIAQIGTLRTYLLYPEIYASVDLSGSSPNRPLVVPAAAILVRRDGAQVAIVTPEHAAIAPPTINAEIAENAEKLILSPRSLRPLCSVRDGSNGLHYSGPPKGGRYR
jgi:hypothetical protein